MSVPRSTLLVVVGLVAVAGALGAHASPSAKSKWVIHDLGSIGLLKTKYGEWSEAVAINNRGQVILAGKASGGDGYFLWQEGRLTNLRSFAPHAINDRGEMVGWHRIGDGEGRAAIWRDGIVRDLASLRTGAQVDAFLINQKGQIAGRGSATPSEQPRHVVLWENGRIRDLGVPRSTARGALPVLAEINERGQIVGASVTDVHDDGADTTYAFISQRKSTKLLFPPTYQSDVADINDLGQVIGSVSSKPGTSSSLTWRPFIWQDGRVSYLSSPRRYPSCAPSDINERGQVIGGCSDRWERQAFLWQGGKRVELGALANGSTTANVINDRGQIVGHSDDLAGSNISHPFVWENGRMTDLGTLGGTEGEAVAINERGQIIGTSTNKRGDIHAVIWTRVG